MAIYLDPPMWPAHGTLFAHLISDTSLDELHVFAAEAGIAERAFDRDHYDVPAHRCAELAERGARQVDAGSLVRILARSGLRIPARERNNSVCGPLRLRWQSLLPGKEDLGEELLERWGEPHRRYHDRTHLLAVLEALDTLAGHLGHALPRAVILAAWFHDAVYDGEPGRDEQRSAEMAQSRLIEAGIPAEEAAEAARLVALTRDHSTEPGDLPGALLCDADLAVLGRDPEGYERYLRAVRQEYAHVSDADFAAGRAAVVRGLLRLEPLYATPAGQNLWERQARTNLRAELSRKGPSMGQRLAILDDYQSVSLNFAPWAELAEEGVDITVFSTPFLGEQDVVDSLRDFDIIVAMRERTSFDRQRLQALTKLKLLVTTGMANAAIDLRAAEEQGVTVCGTGNSATAAPELTWAMLLALARSIPAEDRAIRAGQWQQSVGFELSGKRLGVLGLGKIGRHITRYALAFGMEVLAWSPNLTEETASEAGARKVSKDALFGDSDIVSLHVRLSERSRGLVGERELRLLGPQGILINTARGPLVDEEALLRALHEGWIGGAALDVYDREPLPADHPLLTAPNTVLTPHLGYVTAESYDKFYGEALANVRAWKQGAPVRVLTDTDRRR